MDIRSPTLPPNCGWPHCAGGDDNCHAGLSMPCTIVHPTFDGENLERERKAANARPANRHYGLAVAVFTVVIVGAFWAANAAAGIAQ